MRLSECFSRLRLVAELESRHLHHKSQANRIWNGTSGLMNARTLLVFLKPSDSRDHVYGLLGLIDLAIVSHYSENKTVADVLS